MMFLDKHVLVAGGAGFIGSNLINRLLEAGAHVRATLHNKDPQIHDNRIEYIRCDLENKEDCYAVVDGMDYVFMCAANTSGAAVMEKNPLIHVTPNVIMNSLMLDASYAKGIKKFLFISTNTVYPVSDSPVKENEMMDGDLFDKYFCVGWMKRFSEIMCEMYASKIKFPMKIVVVRPGNIFGEYDDFEWETSHVLPALIRKVVERHNPIEVWGDGNDIKDFIYVQDFIDGLLMAMDKIETFSPINLASGRPCTIKDALQYMLLSDDYRDADIRFDTSKPTMIPKRLIDTSKSKKLLKFEAKTPISVAIERTIKWYKKVNNIK